MGSQQLIRFYLKKDEHTYWTLPVDHSTTGREVIEAIASKLEIRPDLCALNEAKTDKGSVWEREIAPAEKILAIQSKWNPKKYAEKFVVVKPKTVRKENRNSTPAPAASSAVSDDELKYIEESWREKAHDEIELLRKEIQILSETNSSLQQQLFEEKQKRTSMKNPGDVVKQLMDAEQKIDDLKVMVHELQDQSNRLDVENADLFHELNQAARAIGGPYEEKISSIKRTPRKTIQPPSMGNPSSPSPSPSSPSNPRTYFEGNRSDSPNYLVRKDNMTSADYDRNLEVASLGLDLAELQKSQRARERALEESKQKLREELELSKQRRSDVLKESKQVLLEELESIKSKSDLSKKKFEDSLLASRKKLEQELEMIEKKRKAQEDVRWSRPMNGFSSTLSPSKQDGFSISPSSSPTPTRRELFTSSPSPSLSSPSPSKFDTSSKFDDNSFSNSPYSSPKVDRRSSREGSPSTWRLSSERKPFSLS